MGHTQTPWIIVDDLVVRSHDGSNVSGLVVKRMRPDDVALILRAVNCHADLLAALENFVAMYVHMVNSGDCGNWNPETESEVIAARAAIAKAKGEGE